MPAVRPQPAIKSRAARPAGFSLLEVLVVVIVVLVIAAIAIPNLVQSKMRANEASAVASVKTIQQAETLYANTYPDVGFSGSMANLGSHGTDCSRPTATNACIIMDDALISGLKSGYMFELINDGNTPSANYTVTATPESGATGHCGVSGGASGELHFFIPGNPTAVAGRSQGSGGSGGCEL
jgi:type IV pilus assembly protein PilA